MIERPIIFSPPMIRAILAGTKTQTRRVLTRRNTWLNGVSWNGMPVNGWGWGDAWVDGGPSPAGNAGPYLKLPYVGTEEDLDGTVHRVYPRYQPGDLLWVRETWADMLCDPPEARYRADWELEPEWKQPTHGWRPSIHMPRWASRISLRVTDVRVQRVQDISEDDARAEGVECEWYDAGEPISGCWWDYERGCWSGAFSNGEEARGSFRTLWDSIHAKHAERRWSANPWVVAITFERVKP